MGLRNNIIFSSVLTVSSYIFPFITFPYVTRVLGVENFGICSFYDSIVTYFILFSMLGMSTLGIREVAKCHGDKEKLKMVFSSLFVLNLVTTMISIAIMLCSILFVSKFREHPQMLFIGAAKVLSNFLLIEWFYRGLENFKYITIRSILVRTLYVIFVFLLVQTPEDYLLYFFLTTAMFAVNAVINIIYSHNFITITLKGLQVKEYIKPYAIFGAYQILTSMYTSFNVAYLGFVSSNTEVGYYSSSVKLFNILLSFYTAFTGVLLPRMSYLVSNGDNESFSNLLILSFKILFLIAFPIIIISEVYAPEIISIMSGSEFDGAIVPMRIVMPLVLIIGLEQIFVFQILMPKNKDREVFINSIVGALVGIIANFLVVSKLGASGSSLVWLISETCVLIISFCFAYTAIIKVPIFSLFLRRFIYSIPISLIMIFIKIMWPGIISLCISCLVLVCYYFIIEVYVDKDSPIRIILLNYYKR